jgi:hypothetical protein
MKKEKIVRGSVISTFVILYLMVSIISTIHVIDFFELSNPYWLAVTLAIAFEVGAAASLASLVILDKMNRGLVWTLFIAITLMQMQGNMFYAFTNLQDFTSWSELFGLIEEEVIFQKRVIAAVSGAILPLVALGFIKSLVDYIKPESKKEKEEEVKEEILGSEEYLFNLQKNEIKEEPKKESFEDYLVDIPLKYAESYSEPSTEENVEDMRKVVEAYDDLAEEMKDWEEASLTDFVDEWDESQALDQVLNDIAEEVEEVEEIEEIEVTEEPEVVVSEEFLEPIQKEEENENAEEKKS